VDVSSAASGPGPAAQAGVRGTLAATATGVVGSCIFLVLPLLIGALGRTHVFDGTELGLLGAAPLLGMFAGSLLSARLLQGLTYRRVALLGAICLALCHALSGAASGSFLRLALLQFAGGVAGTVLMSMAFLAISRAKSTDRQFAVFVMVQLSTGALIAPLLSKAIDAGGMAGAYAALAVFSLSPLALLHLLPAERIGASAEPSRRPVPRGTGAGVALVLVGQFAFGCGVMALWSVTGLIGSARGWSSASVSQALSLSLLASVAGALLAAAAGRKWPRLAMLCAGALLLVAGAAVAAGASSFPLFVLGTASFAFAWNLMPPFQLGLAADLDRSGRLAVLSIAAVKLGYAAGASLAGLAQSGLGFQLNALLTAASLALSTLAFALPLRGRTSGESR